MKRRTLITGAAATAAAGRVHAAAPALVAVLFPGSTLDEAPLLAAFRGGLAVARVVEGQDAVLAIHYLDSDLRRLPAVAAAIVASRPSVMVCGPTSSVAELRRASTTIPIVMVSVADPVASGFAASLARPGGNVTGLSNPSVELLEKQFSQLLELRPRPRSVIGLRGQPGATMERMDTVFRTLAARFAIAVRIVLLDDHPDLEQVRAAIADFQPDGLFVFADPIALARRRTIAAIADTAKLPVIAPFREFAELGALVVHGASLTARWERAATFVARILAGGDPALIPIEQPTRYELIINLRIARALGIDVSPLMLAGADEVIE